MANNRKPAMPAKLRERGAAAVVRHQGRPIAPEVEMTAAEGKWSYGSPYRPADELAWCALLYEAFGTRQRAVANVFVTQLAQLCSSTWDDEAQAWRPDEQQLQTAIALVQSLAPKDEAQAALAAQAVAIHFATMKLAHSVIKHSWTDARSMASLAALGKTYVRQLEAMQGLKGKRVSRQRITVKNERHMHNHQHVHVAGGARKNGGQAHEGNERRDGGDGVDPTVRGQDAAGNVVPLCGSERTLALPQARRGERIGRAKG